MIKIIYTKNPISLLANIYEIRKDLQTTWPNEKNEGYQNLIDWAVTHGAIVDEVRNLLLKHYNYFYENCSQDAKPLAEKMKIYLQNKEMQRKFPKVKFGDYETYLNFIENRKADNLDLLTEEQKKSFEFWKGTEFEIKIK